MEKNISLHDEALPDETLEAVSGGSQKSAGMSEAYCFRCRRVHSLFVYSNCRIPYQRVSIRGADKYECRLQSPLYKFYKANVNGTEMYFDSDFNQIF